MLRLAVIGFLALGAAACTTSPSNLKSASTEASTDQAGQAASPDQQKTCRDLATTGSYGPRHACHTQAEWDKIDALS